MIMQNVANFSPFFFLQNLGFQVAIFHDATVNLEASCLVNLLLRKIKNIDQHSDVPSFGADFDDANIN